jgi:hypothetical protein
MNNHQKTYSLELLEVIKDQLETIVSYNHTVPLIEIDLLKRNLQNLYQLVDSFNEKAKPGKHSIESSREIDKETEDLIDEAELAFTLELEHQIEEQEKVLEEQVVEEKRQPQIPDLATISEVHRQTLEKAEMEAQLKVTKKEEEVLIPLADSTKIQQPEPQESEQRKEYITPKIEPAIKPEPKVEKATEEAKTIAPAGKRELKVQLPPSIKEENPARTVHILEVSAEEDEVIEENPASQTVVKKDLKSLKNSIGINDKFMIINDLFDGNPKTYNAAIQAFDDIMEAHKALYLLQDMRDENLWENNDLAYQQLKYYVEKRYK